MQATILLFALARQKAGTSTLTVELPSSSTVGDLKAAMILQCPALERMMPFLRISIDSEYAQDEKQLIPVGAELAAIPPVSGGSTLFSSART